jgi:hypothetical protein
MPGCTLRLLGSRVRRLLLLPLGGLLPRVGSILSPLRVLGLRVRRPLLLLLGRLLSARVGWQFLLTFLPLSGLLLSVVLAALRTTESGRGK